MPVTVRVRSNIKQVRRQLKGWQRKALPEAIRNALNDTAFEVRKYIVFKLYKRSFPEHRNKRFPGVAFRVNKATKKTLTAQVFDRLDRVLFPRHIKGLTKRAFYGTHVAVPIGAERKADGKIKQTQLPKNIKNSFVADLGSGLGIWKRLRTFAGRGRTRRVVGTGLQLMFTLKKSTNQRARFPFEREGKREAQRRFPNIFNREVRRSLARLERRTRGVR